MIPVSEALDIIRRETATLPSERVALADVTGRVLAGDVCADMDLPPFDRAQMDGYAVRAADTESVPAELRIVGEAAAGRGWRGRVATGEAVRIMTGAPAPDGADSVQQLEVARESDDGSRVVLERSTRVGQSIVLRASEVRAGATVVEAGEVVTAAAVATLAAFGYATVQVGARPRLAVMATGTELVGVERRPGIDQIRESNTHTLAAYGKLAGADAVRLPLVGDDPTALEEAIKSAVDNSDMIVLSGGVSVGAYDYTKAALRNLGAELFFERVRLRPGKPTVFARIGRTLVFGLPGNPVSAAVTFNLFARTALRLMQGARRATLEEQPAVLGGSVKRSAERASYFPAALRTTDAGVLMADLVEWGGSSDFVSFARADALVVVPEGAGVIEAGATVQVVRLPAV